VNDNYIRTTCSGLSYPWQWQQLENSVSCTPITKLYPPRDAISQQSRNKDLSATAPLQNESIFRSRIGDFPAHYRVPVAPEDYRLEAATKMRLVTHSFTHHFFLFWFTMLLIHNSLSFLSIIYERLWNVSISFLSTSVCLLECLLVEFLFQKLCIFMTFRERARSDIYRKIDYIFRWSTNMILYFFFGSRSREKCRLDLEHVHRQ